MSACDIMQVIDLDGPNQWLSPARNNRRLRSGRPRLGQSCRAIHCSPREFLMLKRLLVAATAVALIAAPVASAYAQAAATEKAKTEKKAAKPLTPQQQKMQACAG